MKKKSISLKSLTDWKHVDQLTDQEIDFSESPELRAGDFKKSLVRYRLKPVSSKVSLAPDVAPFFTNEEMVNQALRLFIQLAKKQKLISSSLKKTL